jgi:hypothetical protein
VSAPEPDPRPRARRVRRAPILLVVIAALGAAAVAQHGTSPSNTTSATRPAAGGVGVAASAVVSSAWYCAEGTSQPGGRADETVVVASMATTSIEATMTVMPGGSSQPVSRTLRLAPGEQTSIRVADVLATPEPGVVVETTGGRAAVSHRLDHGHDFAVEPCTRAASPDWYFAAGTTVPGSEHDLALFNPFGEDAIVDVSFLTDTGPQEPDALKAVVVARRSRVTIPVQDSVLRQARIATQVHARVGRIVVEHTQIFDGTAPDNGPARTGIAVSLGAIAPSAQWRIPSGTTRNGGAASLSLANFASSEAKVEVHVVLVGNQKLAPQSVAVPARGVVSTDVTARVPLGTDYAVTATATDAGGRAVPVVAEILTSWVPSSPTPGIASTLGTTVDARRWIVPKPEVDADGFVTVYDPGPDPVTATLLTADSVDRRVGPTSEPEVAVAPGKAGVLRLVARSRGSAGAWVITANHPIVVGLTLLGAGGASLSAAIPDLTYAG